MADSVNEHTADPYRPLLKITQINTINTDSMADSVNEHTADPYRPLLKITQINAINPAFLRT